MKKKNFNKKLSLNKETISNLNEEKMGKIKGGYPKTIDSWDWRCKVPTTMTNVDCNSDGCWPY